MILIREFDPGLALSILGDSQYKVSHFFAVPAPYQFMMNHPDFDKTDLSNLRIAGIGELLVQKPFLRLGLTEEFQ